MNMTITKITNCIDMIVEKFRDENDVLHLERTSLAGTEDSRILLQVDKEVSTFLDTMGIPHVCRIVYVTEEEAVFFASFFMNGKVEEYSDSCYTNCVSEKD